MGRRTKQPSSFWYSSRSRSSSAPATPRPEPAAAAEPPPAIGCMSMVHYLIFAPGAGCVGRPPTSSNGVVTPHDCHSGLSGGDAVSQRRDDGSSSKSGFEAPRNSLDLDADNPNDIQIGVQIEPVFDALASRTTSMARRSTTKPTAPSSEAETPRTPSLVARLMGIDGLPDQLHPSPSQHKKTGRSRSSSTSTTGKENSGSNCCSPPPPASKEKKKRVIPESMNRREPLRSLSCNVVGAEARSLPDTPRASTSARASWDGPRLSLQALKENVLDRAAHYMSMPSSPTHASGGKRKKKDAACSRRRRDGGERATAKDEHAREILRQAKETVASRKSAGENSSSPAVEKRQSRRCFNNKENVVVMTTPAASAPPAPAMELRVAVQVHQQTAKPTTTTAPKPTSAEHHHSPRVALAPRQQQQQPSPPPPHRAKPSRPPPPPPPLDPPPARARKPDGCERFATRIKKPAASAPPTTSSSSSTCTDSCSAAAARRARVSFSPLEEDPEYSYLRTVLERGGFMRSSPPRRPGRGHSMSSPVDPIVFHLLELELPTDESRLGPLRHRWNRKLLFHLAQELLADLLLGGLDDASTSTTTTTGLPLLGKVWKRVRSFPAANCRVVGDIDALVATDLAERANVRRLARHPAVQEEASDVAEEVADQVLDALVAESVSLSCCAAAHAALSSSRAAGGEVVAVGGSDQGNGGGAYVTSLGQRISTETAGVRWG